jgi:hypothetical protein
MLKPVERRANRFTPRIEMSNCPAPERYTPVVGSEPKFKAGEPTEPLIKLMLEEPAKMVFALTRLTESQISVAC